MRNPAAGETAPPSALGCIAPGTLLASIIAGYVPRYVGHRIHRHEGILFTMLWAHLGCETIAILAGDGVSVLLRWRRLLSCSCSDHYGFYVTLMHIVNVFMEI